MDKENEIVRDAQTLHSDMQTLVYENYNKFISATETIKKVMTLLRSKEQTKFLIIFNYLRAYDFIDENRF